MNASCERLGATPGQLITDRIILEAKRLRRSPDLPACGIVGCLGFSSPVGFSRAFATSTGRGHSSFRLNARGRQASVLA
ncbi:hypothetical protein MEX01_54430 [Methylorubrum extorquens]|uniref:helix-turn-helix domain-containing protein n=1 Tax=Methylorubrum extorquens TaxID=408 RepID=UPI00116F4379|nr:helix-turn-helix domain-containing protein [Methylorubrum extorquens]GEL44852.1 hypothetical protein MEX01_54430 [Methylorubrum extorquens]